MVGTVPGQTTRRRAMKGVRRERVGGTTILNTFTSEVDSTPEITDINQRQRPFGRPGPLSLRRAVVQDQGPPRPTRSFGPGPRNDETTSNLSPKTPTFTVRDPRDCACMCVCVRVRTCTYLCACVHVYVYTCVRVCTCVCAYVYECRTVEAAQVGDGRGRSRTVDDGQE